MRILWMLVHTLYSMALLLSCRIRIDLFFFSIFEIALAPWKEKKNQCYNVKGGGNEKVRVRERGGASTSSPILILFNRSFWIPTFSINISERHCKNSWVLHSVSFKGKIYSTQSWKQIYYLYFFYHFVDNLWFNMATFSSKTINTENLND